MSRLIKGRKGFLGIATVAFFAVLFLYKVFFANVISANLALKPSSGIANSMSCPWQMRGNIVDRGGGLLASQERIISVGLRPAELSASGSWPLSLSAILGIPSGEIMSKVARTNNFVWLKRGITEQEVTRLRATGINGIEIVTEHRREYLQPDLARNLLGFVDERGMGIHGLEGFYDHQLKGSGLPEPATLQLTLDIFLQRYAEQELLKHIKTFGAKDGSLVVMSIETGEILSMASYPKTSPEQLWKEENHGISASPHAVRARMSPAMFFVMAQYLDAARDIMANAVDYSVVSGHTSAVSDPAVEMFKRYFERDKRDAFWEMSLLGHGFYLAGPWSQDFLRWMQPAPALLNDMWGLGFGQLSAVDIQDEEIGALPFSLPADWQNIADTGFVATPIQMLRAFSAMINRGKLPRPHLVIDSEKERAADFWDWGAQRGSEAVPVTERLSLELRRLLASQSGTPVSSCVLAKKNGTLPGSGNESKSYEVVSLGFWPLNAPKIVYILALEGVSDPNQITAPGYGASLKKMAQAAARLPLEETEDVSL